MRFIILLSYRLSLLISAASQLRTTAAKKKSPDLSGFAVRDAKLQEALDTKKPFVGLSCWLGNNEWLCHSSYYTDHPSVKTISNRRFLTEWSYSPVSTSYIRNSLDHLNPRKAVGVDCISPRILSLGSPALAEKVTKSINFCILNRSLPSEWKEARLTPAFKRGIDTDKANYHPVSILTSLSKVFEKVIYDQTWNAFHNVLSSNLSGFMKTHSCCTALLKMTEDWRNSIDNKEAVAAVALDLSEAFDTINHHLLLWLLSTCLGTDVHLPARSSTMFQIRRRML